MPHQPQVEVLFNYESTSSRGHSVIVQPGERYTLVSDANDSWWYVAKETEEADDGFYLPRTYVKRTNDPDDTTTFKPRLSAGDTEQNGKSPNQRRSQLFSTDGYQLLTSTEPTRSGPPHNSFRKGRNPGFKLADPNRISRSIPVDLNFVHNIPEIVSAQEIVDGRMRLSDDQSGRRIETIAKAYGENINNGADLHNDSIYSDVSSELPPQLGSPSVTPEPVNFQHLSDEDYSYDTHVYENLHSTDFDNNHMPRPDENDQPIRVLHDEWEEYIEKSTGRSYFYHRSSHFSSWKPPRNLISAKEVAALLSSSDELDSSYSADDLQKSQVSEYDSDSRALTQSPTAELCGSPPIEPAPTLPAVPAIIRSCPSPAPVKDEHTAGTSHLMTESVDSGLGRGTLSLRNKSYGLNIENRASSYDVYNCSEDLANLATSSPPDSTETSPASNLTRQKSNTFSVFRHKSIKSGTLEKCKYIEAGKKMKKQWMSCFVYLTSAHMIFYKDEKSSERRGNHYAAPLGVCDLRGATITWLESEKKKRKHVFQLELIDDTLYLFHASTSQEVNGWYHAVRQVISVLPKPDFYPTPVIEQEPIRRSLLRRSSASASSASTPVKKPLSPDKNRKRKSAAPTGTTSMDTPEHQIPQRDTILEKLRNFFRSRPSVESLKEKGIYKPERVFGSSLIEICNEEKCAIPKFIMVCTEMIEHRGLDADGLYRISGNLSQIQKIRCQVDQDKYTLLIGEGDVHVLTGTLKLFFRELEEPLFPLSMTKDFLSAIKVQNARQRMKLFRDLLYRMPRTHHTSLEHLVNHLVKVSQHSSKNRMQIHNLAIVFGPTLFDTDGSRKTSAPTKNNKNKRGISHTRSASMAVSNNNSETVQQSNSHLAFNMIMQGQIVEYLLKEHERLFPVAASSK